MEFVPDQKALTRCVRKVEGLTDGAAVRIRRVRIEDSVPIHTNNTSKVVKASVEYEVVAGGKAAVAALAIKVPFLRTKVVYEGGQRLRFFDKEAQFYRAVAPQLQRLLHAPLAPTVFAVDERLVLYMDDLSARGYRVQVAGRLDAEHCAVALRHLARMHAASYALHATDARLLDELVRRQFFIRGESVDKWYVQVRPLLAALAGLRCVPAELVGRFDAAAERAKTDLAANVDSGGFEFSVLNHGDLKAHNILFERDGRGRPVQCSFIDFQICHWTSPALDIIFLAVMSMELQVFSKNFDSLLRCYVLTLNSTLGKLNCDVSLTEAQLKRDMDNVKSFKIFSFLFRTVIDIREFSKDFEYAKSEAASPEVIDRLAQSVEIQDSVRFWLDELIEMELFENFDVEVPMYRTWELLVKKPNFRR